MDQGLAWNCFIAFAVRLLLIGYGIWQDATMVVKYTDVDYNVFTDAARFVTEGDSPYNRGTYRYTPILAWVLTPNIWLTAVWGKVIFVVCDIAAGYLIYKITRCSGSDNQTSIFCAQLWLFNPLPMTVSSRGNAESIMSVLTLATVYLLNEKSPRKLILAAILYGLSVHVKIYPVTYALPIYLYLNEHYTGKPARFLGGRYLDILPNKTRLLFVCVSVTVFAALTSGCYYLYGWQFLYETYLYHIVRKDTRHNFSPYFYMLYLTGEIPEAKLLGLVAFLPQLVLLVLISFKFYGDLPLCCFLQTFIFVAFNKVCTSQYFLWYLTFLPVLIPRLKIRIKTGVSMVTLWFIGQALWLSPAYYLEFEGKNTFLLIWLAGLVFLVVNIWIAVQIIVCYQHGFMYRHGQRVVVEGRKILSAGEMLISAFSQKKKVN